MISVASAKPTTQGIFNLTRSLAEEHRPYQETLLKYLDAEAAETFYILSRKSLELRIIGWSDLQRRLASLLEMIDPNSSVTAALSEFVPPELLASNNDEDQAEQLEMEAIFRSGDSDIERQDIGPPRFSVPPLIMELIVAGVSGMKQWTFHEFDHDPFPSVPHGHRHGQAHPKCDPYTGLVYDGRRKAVDGERLGRKTRIALWQNEKFREFALKAIIWYEMEHPYYEFRVTHPHRLPRLRR